MELYTLKEKVSVRAPSRELWQEWKDKHPKECEVNSSCLYGVTILTRFRGYDPTGAGYLFYTIVQRPDRREEYGAKTWSDAERNHNWECQQIEQEQIIKARQAARQRREQ